MPKKRQAVPFTTAERDILEQFVAHGTKSARAIKRARILLLWDEGRQENDLTTILGVSRGTIYNVRHKYLHKEHAHLLDGLHEAPRRGRPIKIDSCVEAHVTMIACSDPPEGYGRWTLHMIADKLVQLTVIDTISHESIRRTLKKTDWRRGSVNNGASAPSRVITCGIWKMCSTNMLYRMIHGGLWSVLTTGATGVSAWLRLCRWTKDKRTKNRQNKR
jgi:transposase